MYSCENLTILATYRERPKKVFIGCDVDSFLASKPVRKINFISALADSVHSLTNCGINVGQIQQS